ncbi:MAG TPA: hypothetical protein VKB18_05740 [Gemmatimonadota bacterium]|nr:hypothetical protein [Gemmatimonadota bacterium]
MGDRRLRWGDLDPSWDVVIRERAANRSLERERHVRPLTPDERTAVRRAAVAVLEGRSGASAYRLLRPYDGGDGAFDSRHIDLLREVFRRVSEARSDGEAVGA